MTALDRLLAAARAFDPVPPALCDEAEAEIGEMNAHRCPGAQEYADALAEIAVERDRVVRERDDLRLMLRVELCDAYGMDRYHGFDMDGKGAWNLELWDTRKGDGPSQTWTCPDDGTGLPLLTDAARAALRGDAK